jgi:hypothetical protein
VVDICLDTFFEQLNEGADFRFHPIPEPQDEPADERTAQFRRTLAGCGVRRDKPAWSCE